MKKIFAALLAGSFLLAFSTAAFAQELKLSGEAKTGIFWKKLEQVGGLSDNDKAEEIKLHSKDDAGGESNQGRFRLNLDYDNGNGFGMKVRFQYQDFGPNGEPSWEYFLGYGNFFDEQMTVSVGRLGGSPWGTGGPEMWKELEGTKNGGGMRVEWKPNFIPVGQLNVGFVLNWFNSDMDQGWDARKSITLLNLLGESLIGASYTHEYFHVRLAYRFDNEYDAIQDNKTTGGKGEDELLYRIEEYVIKNYLPYFKVWAMGYYFGISAYNPDITLFQNWLFAEYAPDMFTAQIRFGLDIVPSRTVFHVKPSFYWNVFDRMLTVGASFWYGQDFGAKVYEGSPYTFMELEPKLQFNFSSSYIAFAYNFRREYLHGDYPERGNRDPIKQTQWMNLRFCIYY
jgi:hypothetical protein